MLKQLLFIVLLSLLSLSVKSQQLFHQDIFYGGVPAAGFSTGIGAWWPEDTITIHIEPGSTIRNAWLFVYSFGHPTENSIVLDGQLIEIDTVEHFLSEFDNTNPQSNPVRLYAVDITHIINTPQTQYSIEILNVHSVINWGYWSPVLYVEYENNSLDKITTSLWYNDSDCYGNEVYNFTNLNSINYLNEFALSIFSDRDGENNPSQLHINNTQFGEFNQNDSYNTSTNGVGVQGHFYYQNELLYGLGDDNPNSTMYGSDAIAIINSYLNTGDNGYELRMLQHQNPAPPGLSSIKMIFPHAYTTPCDTFSTDIIADTSVCLGDSLQLFASGGNNYEWLTTHGMNNPSLANPMVAPDSTQRYWVRIENEPGCTRTEQVLVAVLPNPTVDSVSVMAETCGEENGEVVVWSSSNEDLTYSLGSLSQETATFSGLETGAYELSVINSQGCSLDSTVLVPLDNAVEANFSANPESGAEQLDVTFKNTSENASDYEWYIDQGFWDDSEHTSAYFDSTGNYLITLYAYNNRPECVDSSSFTLVVRDTIYARIPNVITPNNDNVNDVFTIDVRRAATVEAQFFNRWGNPIANASAESNGLDETIPLWDGKTTENQKVTEGTYFYTISIVSVSGRVYDFQGSVMVVH
jgi:gliding motility-associated-like protein